MSQSLAKLWIHLIFSTKGRKPFLDAVVRSELHPYLATVLKGMDSPALIINSVEDHAHVLFHLSKKHALCDVVEEAKKSTSKWLKSKGDPYASFYWQGGYAAFSVSQSNVEEVRRYIERQPEHHRRLNFQDELRAFFKRYQIEYDERYVWD